MIINTFWEPSQGENQITGDKIASGTNSCNCAIYYRTALAETGTPGGWGGTEKSFQSTAGVEMAVSQVYFPGE